LYCIITIFCNKIKIMRVITVFIISLLCVLGVRGQGECGVSSSGPVDYIQPSTKQSNTAKDVRLMLWVVQEDDGSGGASTPEVQLLAVELEDVFSQPYIGINLHICVREVHSSAIFNRGTGATPTGSGFRQNFDHPCYRDYVQFSIYDWDNRYFSGAAELGGRLGYSIPNLATLGHELGHRTSSYIS